MLCVHLGKHDGTFALSRLLYSAKSMFSIFEPPGGLASQDSKKSFLKSILPGLVRRLYTMVLSASAQLGQVRSTSSPCIIFQSSGELVLSKAFQSQGPARIHSLCWCGV